MDTNDWPSSRTSRNIDIYTGNGDTLTMRIDYDADIYGNTPTGSFDLVGMGGQFKYSSPYTSGYQILPRGSSDITINAIACSDMIDSVTDDQFGARRLSGTPEWSVAFSDKLYDRVEARYGLYMEITHVQQCCSAIHEHEHHAMVQQHHRRSYRSE